MNSSRIEALEEDLGHPFTISLRSQRGLRHEHRTPTLWDSKVSKYAPPYCFESVPMRDHAMLNRAPEVCQAAGS
eukprot:CAMPEP_0115189882 /NCGR_PEP_ID=MMETSP0270-20121206/11742_1 /TAXON_ID=71861 /ORGANISM="Scrippsiella trochoidea, Strain CCMP3099" /LENGTH=73 /DNA_ID=CAMNT_0002603083 /DNA_START=730 /DNA_END=951 /DNA_ORIENTATION=+